MGLASARVVSRAGPLPRGRPGPFWLAAPFVFQDGSFLSFVQPFVNTELIQICAQTPPASCPSPPRGPAGDTQGPDTQLGPWPSRLVSKAVGLGPCLQDRAVLEGQLGELGRWREAAVQSRTPRKGTGEKDQGTLISPRPCAHVRVSVTPAEGTGSVFTEAETHLRSNSVHTLSTNEFELRPSRARAWSRAESRFKNGWLGPTTAFLTEWDWGETRICLSNTIPECAAAGLGTAL